MIHLLIAVLAVAWLFVSISLFFKYTKNHDPPPNSTTSAPLTRTLLLTIKSGAHII